MFQSIVLLLFNDVGEMTTDDIEKATKIEREVLHRTLQSLSLGKFKIVTKTPHTRAVGENDKWQLNEAFTHGLYRIVVNSIQATETVEESTATTEKVFEDRIWQIDAALVRIMKSKKRASMQQIVVALFEAVQYPVEIADLKKRLESLLDRDYISREEGSNNWYLYCA